MLASAQLDVTVQVAVVAVPVAMYFLLLGLFNSQRTPQLLPARRDFILLVAAFLPVLVMPALNYVGVSAWTVVLATGGACLAAVLAAPRGSGQWVIYNIQSPEALRACERSLQSMGLGFVRCGRRLRLEGMDAELRLWAMPLLRNVSLSVGGPDAGRILPEFQHRLAGQLGLMPTQATPMALAFVLIATVMLVAPLGMVADRMPEMVRLITNLVH
jgi:hypothetical protein